MSRGMMPGWTGDPAIQPAEMVSLSQQELVKHTFRAKIGKVSKAVRWR